ncbi:hypothetical protein ONE63_004236 [Megalurothrips usitatus]|uniref:Cilia-and flagella-associated protein 96 n=1 Tax=Megalurothrips usitatus TaxID=439358 RepID=A0AAV7X930_9NEOP|nr:hypothetical protein ONE63_004236 [Megalurothrips usitatus]
MPKAKRPLSNIGVHHGKRDLERVGVFAETSWMHGVPYVSPHGYEFRAGGTKGRQMIPGGGRTKVGLQDCYFDRGPFKRIFEKEAYSSALRDNYLSSMAASKRNLSSMPFIAGAPGKKHSTPGDFYGTFAGRIDAMSRQEKARLAHKSEPPNFKTNPGKKGTYGYVDITFNPFPKHMSETYQSKYGMAAANRKLILNGPFVSTTSSKPCFDTNPWLIENRGSTYIRRPEPKSKYRGSVWVPPSYPKMQGNNHDGCFSKFPQHMSEKYIDFFRILQGSKESRVFYPQIQQKSMYTTSVMNTNVDFRVNAKNWRTFQPVTYPFNALTN